MAAPLDRYEQTFLTRMTGPNLSSTVLDVAGMLQSASGRHGMTERRMKLVNRLVLCVTVGLLGATGCGDDGDSATESSPGASTASTAAGGLTAPANLQISTVDGKPHLRWTDAQGEDHYMIERMDHASGSTWVAVMGADSLVFNSIQYHDASAAPGATYMYRVVAMQGQTRAVSNEVTWTAPAPGVTGSSTGSPDTPVSGSGPRA